jgi:hypothetical protein
MLSAKMPDVIGEVAWDQEGEDLPPAVAQPQEAKRPTLAHDVDVSGRLIGVVEDLARVGRFEFTRNGWAGIPSLRVFLEQQAAKTRLPHRASRAWPYYPEADRPLRSPA